MSDTVLYEAQGAIARITLNRPDRLNAMNRDLAEELLGHVERAASDDSVRVVVLTGTGKGFCAGGDLSGGGFSADKPLQNQINRLRQGMRSSQLLHEMPKITIAAINGACAGAGLSLACACDLRFAADGAKFNTAFINAGLSGDYGGTWTLSRIVGPAKARELYLLATRFDAGTALQHGLVSEVLDSAQALQARVEEIATRLAQSPPLALRRMKANLNDALTLPFSAALDREAERHARCANTEDHREAALAFMEKRQGNFKGR